MGYLCDSILSPSLYPISSRRPRLALPMFSSPLFRLAARTHPPYLLRPLRPAKSISPREYAGSAATAGCCNFSTSIMRAADKDGQEATGGSGHHEETFEEFTARYAHLPARLSLISQSRTFEHEGWRKSRELN